MPYRPLHPGAHLKDELDARGMSAAALGRALRVPHNRITEIINGERAITADTALRLAKYFNTSAEMWLGLQQEYDLALARVASRRVLAQIKAPRPGQSPSA